ncbi:MAG: hypothetical protein LW817_04520 [Candidatus Caenarcaniphilales bacterium]|jgi:hypothetical protein|nr:hypothetical protein [Candidatus Caenarcaniphilales bacterium]
MIKISKFIITAALIISVAIDAHAASILPYETLFGDVKFPVYAKTGNKAIFKYKVDKGAVGEINSSEAIGYVEEVLDMWAAQGAIEFDKVGDGLLNEDINANNDYNSFLNPSDPNGFSPVIWDADGSIIEDLYGASSKNSVLGFAGATFYSNNFSNIEESMSFFNGYLFQQDVLNENAAGVRSIFRTTILHEFAHMFGLDHTQGGNNDGFIKAGRGEISYNELTDVPVMFPVAANPLVELQQDDIASVKSAYPSSSDSSTFGKITGKLLKNGKALKGVNIVAFKADDTNPRKKAVACPSDVDGKGQGKFIIPNLVPGQYIVYAEPINSDFIEGSSIGSHTPIKASQMNTGFYMGDKNQMLITKDLDKGVTNALRITVSAGSSTDLNFETNNSSGSGGSDGEPGTQTFILGGRVLNRTAFAYNGRFARYKMKIVNLFKGETRNLSFSSSYPDLIQFAPETISFVGKSRRIDVILAPLEKFVAEFPELNDLQYAEIPITVTDLDSGYSEETFIEVL